MRTDDDSEQVTAICLNPLACGHQPWSLKGRSILLGVGLSIGIAVVTLAVTLVGKSKLSWEMSHLDIGFGLIVGALLTAVVASWVAIGFKAELEGDLVAEVRVIRSLSLVDSDKVRAGDPVDVAGAVGFCQTVLDGVAVRDRAGEVIELETKEGPPVLRDLSVRDLELTSVSDPDRKNLIIDCFRVSKQAENLMRIESALAKDSIWLVFGVVSLWATTFIVRTLGHDASGEKTDGWGIVFPLAVGIAALIGQATYIESLPGVSI